MSDRITDFWGDPIHVYTRADALADGVLIDLTDVARTVSGFVWPVACTSRVYHGFIDPQGLDGQDAEGRAHDLLWMLGLAVGKAPHGTRSLTFTAGFQMPTGKRAAKPARWRVQMFRAVCGPGDNGEPVITVMMPDED